MANCNQCGVEIDDGQSICSMCYGDPYYGSDDYYLQYLEECEEEERQREQAWLEDMEEDWSEEQEQMLQNLIDAERAEFEDIDEGDTIPY